MMPRDEPYLRYWVYRHGDREYDWRVLSQTNDEPTARWLYANVCAALREGGVRLIDTETTTVIEECHRYDPPLGVGGSHVIQRWINRQDRERCV